MYFDPDSNIPRLFFLQINHIFIVNKRLNQNLHVVIPWNDRRKIFDVNLRTSNPTLSYDIHMCKLFSSECFANKATRDTNLSQFFLIFSRKSSMWRSKEIFLRRFINHSYDSLTKMFLKWNVIYDRENVLEVKKVFHLKVPQITDL